MIHIINNSRLHHYPSIGDFIIFFLVIGCLAFSDKDIICLGSQIIALIYALFKIIHNKKINKDYIKYLSWILCFFAFCITSFIWAKSYNTTILSTSIAFLQFGSISMCVLIYCEEKEKSMNIVDFVIYSALLLCVRFVLIVPISDWGTIRSLDEQSIFLSNETAMAMAFASIFLFWKTFIINNSKSREKLFALIKIAIMMLVVLLMGTKKGLIIFLIGLTIFYLYNSQDIILKTKKIVILLLGMMAVIYTIMNVDFLYEAIGNRMELMIYGFLGVDTDGSTRTRMLFIENALVVFKEYPVFGIGQDGFRYENYYQFTYSHNNYTELLANLGLVGFSLYYSLFMNLVYKSLRIIRYNILPFAVVFILLILDFASVSYSSEVKAIWISLVISICSHVLYERG